MNSPNSKLTPASVIAFLVFAVITVMGWLLLVYFTAAAARKGWTGG